MPVNSVSVVAVVRSFNDDHIIGGQCLHPDVRGQLDIIVIQQLSA